MTSVSCQDLIFFEGTATQQVTTRDGTLWKWTSRQSLKLLVNTTSLRVGYVQLATILISPLKAEAVIRKRLHGLPIKLFNMLSEFEFYARDEMLILESMQEKELRVRLWRLPHFKLTRLTRKQLELAASWGVLQECV